MAAAAAQAYSSSSRTPHSDGLGTERNWWRETSAPKCRSMSKLTVAHQWYKVRMRMVSRLHARRELGDSGPPLFSFVSAEGFWGSECWGNDLEETDACIRVYIYTQKHIYVYI